MEPVEIISDDNGPVAYFINRNWTPQKTEFLTPGDLGQQVGMIVYGKGDSIQPHKHLPIVREVHGTTECVRVEKGKCFIDIYSENKDILDTRIMQEGDIVLLLGGAHGFRMIEDTILFEVKQGPYAGEADKERF
ncbi:hypothetical protein OAA59_02055 [bacterium]|nr:hypothetical protein [bacterium]